MKDVDLSRNWRMEMEPKVDKARIQEMAQEVKPEQADQVLKRKRKIKSKASRGPLKRIVTDINIMLSLLNDYWTGKYVKAPWWTVSAILVALIWLLNPMDVIPDYIPLLGMLDDAAVIAIVLAMIEQDISDYREWKQSQKSKRRNQ